MTTELVADTAHCPECGAAGTEVPRRTVAAVTRAPLPPHQRLRLCRTADCPLLYFGDQGARIAVSALGLQPWSKGGDVVCFCFLHRAGELADGSRDAVVASITARVRAGDCACDLRNPSGKCCLSEIRERWAAVVPPRCT